MTTFTAVVVSHANERGLRAIIGNLMYQTRKPDETIALCSDTPALARLREEFPHVRFLRCRNMADWGHAKRARGLRLAGCEWVGFFNDDDSYSSDYLEKMLRLIDGADVVYSSWNEQPNCDFHITHSTAGNFICRTKLGRRAGYTSRRYEADGDFIEALKAAGARVVRQPELLYWHNVQA